MATSPATPRAPRNNYGPTTPATSRVSATISHAVQSSPHYATTRRHSLYGVEDRVIIDPGSRIWKVGFSGEGRPRDLFYAGGSSGAPLWRLRRAVDPVERAEEDRILELRLEDCLRSVFHDSLLADPKARKVILVEHPLLPLYIKEIIARILFENQVPSVSFAPSHLLSLFAVGRITGLVIDCGHLESVALPIFAARPLFPQIQTTPIAGSHLTSHLRALLLLFATYLPPPTSLSTSINVPAANRATRVPQEVLTDAVVEEIKTRCCFVGDVLDSSTSQQQQQQRGETRGGDDDLGSEMDIPPSDSSFTTGSEFGGGASQPDSEFSIITGSRQSGDASGLAGGGGVGRGEGYLQALANMYKRHSTATDIQMRVMPPPAQQTGTGRGTLIIPGWIRERATEVLFEGGDVDESSLAEVVLDALLKVPRDLRKTMASSILVSGGTAMLPGFIPRLHAEIVRACAPPPPPPSPSKTPSPRHEKPMYDKYAGVRPLLPYFAILNNPNPPLAASERAKANAGKAPAFAPAMLAWVGGSLAGALKTGGAEVARERWDEVEQSQNMADDSMDVSDDPLREGPRKSILPDWTRMPLPMGAPPANANAPTVSVTSA
ncbi:unnamed protein product [Cyclocybe aegerita]|uniref:Actin-related protein 10 n=1 Tax=Cyclocybe aegerita TaxID=1973307 RepID=A0A8S0VYL5_CYCAE|nr:unnamed protein product [Cyclocybe aegerita]